MSKNRCFIHGLAIITCSQVCCVHPQHCIFPGWWSFFIGVFNWNQTCNKNERKSYFLLIHVCTAKWSPRKQLTSKKDSCPRLGVMFSFSSLHSFISFMLKISTDILSLQYHVRQWFLWNQLILKTRHNYTLQVATTVQVSKVQCRQLKRDAWYGPQRKWCKCPWSSKQYDT